MPLSAAMLTSPLWLATALPASAFEFTGYAGSMNSYYVTLGTFHRTSLRPFSPETRPIFTLPTPHTHTRTHANAGLFIMTVPGLYSLIKRSPKSKIKRKTYTVAGPKAEGAKQLDEWAKTIAAYFFKYNYRIVGTGDVVTFEGTYQASTSQAFAISFYTLFSLASVALVLSIVVPDSESLFLLPSLSLFLVALTHTVTYVLGSVRILVCM